PAFSLRVPDLRVDTFPFREVPPSPRRCSRNSPCALLPKLRCRDLSNIGWRQNTRETFRTVPFPPRPAQIPSHSPARTGATPLRPAHHFAHAPNLLHSRAAAWH